MSLPEPSAPDTGVSLRDRLLQIYERLLAAYGPQGWWPGGGDPFEVVVGAILTQSVSWKNVERALANLRGAGALSARGLLALDDARLAELVRPSGYYTVKARRLRAFVRMLVEEFEGDLASLFALPLPALREKLLATYGIGQETADDIILYAAGQASFVIDVYTVRLFARLGIRPAASGEGALRELDGNGSDDGKAVPVIDGRLYRAWQRLFTEHLPADAALFNEYHALIVRHGVVRCRKRTLLCGGCPLLDLCPTGTAGRSRWMPLIPEDA